MNVSQKRLAIFLPGLYDGGAERVMLNLASGLCRRGTAVDLVLSQAEGPYMNDLPDSVRLVELNRKHRGFLRTQSSLPAFIGYLKRERPDALLTGLQANTVAVWARRLVGIPRRVVITEQNTFSLQNQLLPGSYRWLMPYVTRYFYQWADSIIAVSEGVADDLAHVTAIPRQRIQVIYNPIVTNELKAKAQAPLQHPWFQPGEPPVILAVGRLTRQKAFDTLLQSFAQVRQNRPARLLILGEGEDRSALEAQVSRLGLDQDVSMPGFVSNPYPYMVQSSLFVLSSRWEGLPTVLVEALYCGAPVISTDCPSGPQEILKGGKYGKLVPVDDVGSLAQAILAALDGPVQHPAQESWQPFELETVIDQYIDSLFGV